MVRKSVAGDRPELVASVFEGQSKKARGDRAWLLSKLQAQTRIFFLHTPLKDDGKVLVYAVVMGDEKSDREFAQVLASSHNLATSWVDENSLIVKMKEEMEALIEENQKLREQLDGPHGAAFGEGDG